MKNEPNNKHLTSKLTWVPFTKVNLAGAFDLELDMVSNLDRYI